MDIEILRNVSLFSDLSKQELERIAEKVHALTVPENIPICREHALEESLHIIISGQVQVSMLTDSGDNKIIAMLKDGDHFGEMAILTGEPRSATITTLTSCNLWTIYKRDLDPLLHELPGIAVNLSRTLAYRLSKTNKLIAKKTNTKIITIALNKHHPELLPTIIEQLSKQGRVAKELAMTTSLSSESIHNFKLKQDIDYHIGVISLSEIDQYRDIINDNNLTLISIGHPTLIQKGTLSLPDGNPLRFVETIIRKILGHTVGLALSSGTAQGLTHLGVLRAFSEESIKIDMIAGTSGGALYGSPYAIGANRADHEKQLSKAYNKGLSGLIDLNIPRDGLIKGQKIIDKVLKSVIGDASFSDVKIPLLIVASDISTAREIVYQNGKIWKAVRASLSIPAIFNPIKDENNRIQVDGAVTTPVPVEPLLDHGMDYVIAVHTSEIARFSKTKPTMLDIFMRSRSVTSDRIAEINCEKSRLVIKPDASHISSFEYERLDELIKIGDEATRKVLPAVKALTHS